MQLWMYWEKGGWAGAAAGDQFYMSLGNKSVSIILAKQGYLVNGMFKVSLLH